LSQGPYIIVAAIWNPADNFDNLFRYIAGNMLISCNNSKALGWRPQHPDIYTVLNELK
jgi:hypothetical protein